MAKRCNDCRQRLLLYVQSALLLIFFVVTAAAHNNSPKDARSCNRLHDSEADHAVDSCFISPSTNERFRRQPAAIFISNNDDAKQNNRHISRHLQKLQDDAKHEEERQQRHAKSHMFSGAMHQVEHRAKEKTSIKIGEKAATQLLKSTERKGLSRLAERLFERIQIVWESVTGRGVERYGERFVERFGERAGERVAERGAVTGQRLLSRAERKMATGVAERAGERVAETTGQRFLSRGERRMATGVAERAGERITERTGQRMAERTAERGATASSKYSAAARRSIGRHVAELGERTSETGLVLASKGRRAAATATDRASYAAVRTTERMARSVARIFLIALPALGGLFALWLLKADVKRIREVREERVDFEWAAYGALPSKRRPCLPSTMFAGAAVADLVDAIAHFVIAYAVLIELGHSKILKWEEISMACAIVSTIMAIAGEVADWRKMNKYRSLTGDNQ